MRGQPFLTYRGIAIYRDQRRGYTVRYVVYLDVYRFQEPTLQGVIDWIESWLSWRARELAS